MPAGDFRPVGAHAVSDDHAVGMLLEPVGDAAIGEAGFDRFLVAAYPHYPVVVVTGRATPARIGGCAELHFDQRRRRTEGSVASESKLRGREVEPVLVVSIVRMGAMIHSRRPVYRSVHRKRVQRIADRDQDVLPPVDGIGLRRVRDVADSRMP